MSQREKSGTVDLKDQPLVLRSGLAHFQGLAYKRGMEHHVYFWLVENYRNEESCAAFEAGLETLCTSPFIAQKHWGRPAATAERPVTDHSWDYALSLKFASMEDHEKYQENDPIHDGFIAKFKDQWEKVLVMDLA